MSKTHFRLADWKFIIETGTSGDQVTDILADWEHQLDSVKFAVKDLTEYMSRHQPYFSDHKFFKVLMDKLVDTLD